MILEISSNFTTFKKTEFNIAPKLFVCFELFVHNKKSVSVFFSQNKKMSLTSNVC